MPLMLIAFFFAFRFSMTEERLQQIQNLIAQKKNK